MPDAVTIRDAFAHYQEGRQAEAVRVCRTLLAAQPNDFNALNILGAIQLQQREFSAARETLARAIACKPDSVETLVNLGSCLDALQAYDEARQCYQQALALNPEYPAGLAKLGNSLNRAGDYQGAAHCYQRALRHTPGDATLRNNYGMALAHRGRYQQALDEYQQALDIRPDYCVALANRASALASLQRFQESAATYARLLALEPRNREALAKAFMARRHICDWQHFEQTRDALLAEDNLDTITPFNLLSLTDSGGLQLAVASSFSRQYAAAQASPAAVDASPTGKIRIAYISADFREHPVSFLMAGVFEQHDRDRFELTGVSLQATDNSSTARRVVAAFDHWLDVSDLTDAAAADLIRARNIHIAVDLTGYTKGHRAGILALRPAPLQVNYLGFPGTLGADFIDYIVADDYLVPEQSSAYYREAIIRLPSGFQAFDDRAVIDDGAVSREAAGLPAQGWVFCGFNASYKLNPTLFDSWMRILGQVPDSVLWLLAREQATRDNLQREAETRGIQAKRLVFAGQTSYARHLARLPLADLFLDTFPFNAGTSASDALRMGLPLLTCSGESFASRMAGSLLHSLGLPQLIATDLASYEANAIRFASGDPGWPELRQRLTDARATAPIFDTAAFCRKYESALIHLWNQHQAGKPPGGF